MLVTREDADRDWLSVGRHLCHCVGCFVKPPWDVVELEDIELILKLPDFLAISSHLRVVAA
jgi:hypothetical protein